MDAEFYDKIAFDNQYFPIKACLCQKVDQSSAYALSRLSWHEELELKHYRKGGAKLQIGSEVLYVQDNDVVIVNPCEPHCTISVADECEYDVMIFNVAFIRERFNDAKNIVNFQPFVEGRLRFRRLIRGNEQVTRAVESLFDQIGRKGDNMEMAIVGLLLWLFALLFQSEVNGVEGQSPFGYADKLRKLQPSIEYINANYGRQLDLALLASKCSLNPTYFSKMFKEVMRVNVKDYINQLRLNSAEVLLNTTDRKITEIASDCGFEDGCYFERWFKKNKGISPGKYRNKEMKGDR